MRAAVLKFTFAVIVYQSNKFYITYSENLSNFVVTSFSSDSFSYSVWMIIYL